MNTVVYYPYASPRPEWLKLAALCWDKVYRLTTRVLPQHGGLDDPDEVKMLDEALGSILEPIYVSEVADLPEVEDQFLRWIDAREERLKVSEWAPEGSDEDKLFPVSALHHYKMGPNLFWTLQERGLARAEVRKLEHPGSFSLHGYDSVPRIVTESKVLEEYEKAWQKGWEEAEKFLDKNTFDPFTHEALIYMPADIARYYLALCAARVAEDEKRDLVADGEKFTDPVFYDYSTRRGEVVKTVVQAYLPKDFSNLEIERIVAFRDEFGAQRLAYQMEVQNLVDDAANALSEGEEALERWKANVIELGKQRVDDTRRTYRRAKQETVVKTYGMLLTPPAIATSLGSALGIGMFDPTAIVAAVSFLGAQLLLDQDKAERERAQSPWSYVLDAAKL